MTGEVKQQAGLHLHIDHFVVLDLQVRQLRLD